MKFFLIFRFFSIFQDRTVKVWRADDGVLCRTLTGHAHWINTLALSCDYALRLGFFSPEAQAKGEQQQKPEENTADQVDPKKFWP